MSSRPSRRSSARPEARQCMVVRGEVPEWLKGTVLKTVEAYPLRGFESRPLRQCSLGCVISERPQQGA